MSPDTGAREPQDSVSALGQTPAEMRAGADKIRPSLDEGKAPAQAGNSQRRSEERGGLYQDVLSALDEEIAQIGAVWESNPTLTALRDARATIVALTEEVERLAAGGRLPNWARNSPARVRPAEPDFDPEDELWREHTEHRIADMAARQRAEAERNTAYDQKVMLHDSLETALAEVARLWEQLDAATNALRRLVPILHNSEEAFRKPPSYTDPSLTGWRFEGLASGAALGLRIARAALGEEG